MAKSSPWRWVPSLYFTQGLPYVVVMNIAIIMYKRVGISNSDIAFYTGMLNLPWVIKPIWSPIVDMLKSKRWWIVSSQLIITTVLAAIALVLPGPAPFRYSLIFMFILAFGSATHDIAVDGFYMLELSKKQQALFIGWRNTFYRVAMVTGQGLFVMFAGVLESRYALRMPIAEAIPKAWSMIFFMIAALFLLFFIYHRSILPYPKSDKPVGTGDPLIFFKTFKSFFSKKGIISALLFIFFYRFAEAQLVKIASPFMLDAREIGGLGLTTAENGFIYGTIGVIALLCGGILGGTAMAKEGLKPWLWKMALALNLPNIVYLLLAIFQPSSLWSVSACVAVEQFGYGFGFTAMTYFMMLFSKGENQTAHYSICTGIMALGLMLPGMISGMVEEMIGYQNFFIWIMICTIPSFLVAKFVKIPENE